MSKLIIEVTDDQALVIGEAFAHIFVSEYDEGYEGHPGDPEANPPVEPTPARPAQDKVEFARGKIIEYIQTIAATSQDRRRLEEVAATAKPALDIT